MSTLLNESEPAPTHFLRKTDFRLQNTDICCIYKGIVLKYYMMIKKITIHKIWAFLLAMILLLTSFDVSSFAYTSQVATIKASNVNVRSGPGTNYSKLTQLKLGAQVMVTDEQTGSDGSTWCSILYNNGANSGFISKSYVAMGSTSVYEGVSEESFEQMLTNQGFLESYKPYLRSLHSKYPNWTFTAVKTGIDWQTAVDNECVVGRNLVYKDSVTSWKSTEDGAFDWNNNYWPGFDGNSWQAASEDIIKYYMDPRNFLDSTYVFQFLDHSYNSNIHKASGVETMVKGTFLESSYTGSLSGGISAESISGNTNTQSTTDTQAPTSSSVMFMSPGQAMSAASSGTSSSGSDTVVSGPGSALVISPGSTSGPGAGSIADTSGATYIDMIMKAAEQSGVNPYVLASMIIQEQGTKGTSGAISGSYGGYSGIYNFYNVEAYASNGMDAVSRGLWWASQSGTYDRPWNTKEKAIVGGAKFYGEGYLKKTQNTFYLKKFNVTKTNTYKHQYMTNVQAAASEGYHLAQAYSSELRTAAHNFEIPVYKNMPDTACPQPTGDGSPNNKLNGLYVDGFALTPTFNSNVQSYDLIVDNSVTSVNIGASLIDSRATVSGVGTVNLANGNNKINVIVTAENKTQRIYVLNVVRQSGGPTYNAGIGGSSSGGPGTNYITVNTGSSNTSTTVNTSTTSSGTSSGKTNISLTGPGGATNTSAASSTSAPAASSAQASTGTVVTIISNNTTSNTSSNTSNTGNTNSSTGSSGGSKAKLVGPGGQ